MNEPRICLYISKRMSVNQQKIFKIGWLPTILHPEEYKINHLLHERNQENTYIKIIQRRPAHNKHTYLKLCKGSLPSALQIYNIV